MANNHKKQSIIYGTDDIEQAKAVAANYDDISVEYHSRDRKIPPVLTFIADGEKHTKYNPEYVEYLKENFPGISDEEIKIRIEQELSKDAKAVADNYNDVSVEYLKERFPGISDEEIMISIMQGLSKDAKVETESFDDYNYDSHRKK